MRWYDYIMCVLIADYITAFLFASNIFVVIPIIWYYLYEDMRKQTVIKARKDD